MDLKFTTKDDENLMYYLATVSSGLEEHMGNRDYRGLIELVCSCPSSLFIHSYINSSFFGLFAWSLHHHIFVGYQLLSRH